MGDDDEGGGENEGRTFSLSCHDNCDCVVGTCKRLEQSLSAMQQISPVPGYIPGDFKRNVTVLNNVLENMSFALGVMARLTEEAFLMDEVI